MIYITGDTHREFDRLYDPNLELSADDLVIILGDVGLNYCLDSRDDRAKKQLYKLPCRFLFIRGNHEERPENIDSYHLWEVDGIVKGQVYIEQKYPRFMFAAEGLYQIGDYRCFISNGAYSIDKFIRKERGLNWFPGEELTDEEMAHTLALAKAAGPVDFVMTHACPQKYFPFDGMIAGIDPATVSKRMEEFYDKVEGVLDYRRWYCGHYHVDRRIDKMQFMYYDLIELR